MKKIFTLLFVLCSMYSFSQSVVISQIYGGGGNGGSVYTNDFIELFNASAAPVSLSGWSVQYNSATSTTTTWQMTNLPNITLQPGQYFLVQEAQGAGGTTPLPTPDATGTIALSGTAGKVALVSNQTAFTIGCPLPNAAIKDFVGFGTTANCFEGTGSTPAPSNTTSILRGSNGCTDNNNNATDFTVSTSAIVARNTATALSPCGPATPTLTATSLTSFGNVCVNTTSAANSFTITGSNLTNSNVTVGPLAGFTFSTTSGGTYTASLSITQPGGSFSQAVFVKLSPVAVQSYNGNIPVAGGGTSSTTNVAATGSGVDSAPAVTTGASSAITSVSATLAGSITANGCSAVTAYGIEYSTTNGFANGSGIQVPSSNLVSGNFSSDLFGLSPGITYYYHAYATNGGGTTYGAQQSFTTISLSPVITVTALAGFGNVCQNTTSSANSFTVSGTNLTNADIIVGPLAGYTFSTTAAGTFTSTLTLTQPGGPTYSQQVFVKLSPVVVQSYNGNIPVSGGGATATSVAATGSGVNTAATVATGAASAITTNSATLAGSVTATGCSTVSAYGIEYSTANNFPNGTGTLVASTNMAAGNFTSAVSGLLPSTTYYYKAVATNAGGTVYGTQQTFTTAAPVLTATPLTAFGSICVNTTTPANSFTISSTGLTAANVIVGPKAGYTFSTTAGGVYTTTLTITQPGGAFNQAVFVKFTPVAVQSYSGTIPVTGGGAAAINVAVSGSGVNSGATLTTGDATNITANSATLAGTVNSNGCSGITEQGIEYSSISGFSNGHGIRIPAMEVNGSDFSSAINGLVQGSTYYFKAYAINSGTIAYGSENTFTTLAIPDGFTIYSSPVSRGGNLHFTLNNIKPGHYAAKIYNITGQLVFQRDMILQVNFIDDNLSLPSNLGTGLYTLRIGSTNYSIQKRFMIR